jgi:hypothetical protein
MNNRQIRQAWTETFEQMSIDCEVDGTVRGALKGGWDTENTKAAFQFATDFQLQIGDQIREVATGWTYAATSFHRYCEDSLFICFEVCAARVENPINHSLGLTLG